MPDNYLHWDEDCHFETVDVTEIGEGTKTAEKTQSEVKQGPFFLLEM